MTLDRLSRHGEAIGDWREALSTGNGTSRRFLESGLALSLAHDGQHSEATALARRLLKEQVSVKWFYDLNCVFAIASNAASSDARLTADQRLQLADRYATTAVAILKSVARSGFFNVPKYQPLLQTDPNLNPLRHRKDFRDLAKSVGVELPAWALKPKAIRNAAIPAQPTKAPKPASP